MSLGSLFHNAQFLTSAQNINQCPEDQGFEVAFAGRSNAGKSSAINALTGQKKLARISKTPGRTQLINFFQLDSERRLVDLPGYGYAKVPEAMKRRWQLNLERYLRKRNALIGLVLVMDVRHPLTEFDHTMLQWAQAYDMHAHILLTKADKLKRGPAKSSLLHVKKHTMEYGDHVTVQLFSATKRQGLDELMAHLAVQLQVSNGEPCNV